MSAFGRDFLKCGDKFFGDREFGEAIECYKQALEKAANWKDEYKVYLWLGNCYLELSDFSNTLFYYGQAERAARENNDSEKVDQVLQAKELCHTKSRNFPAAEKIRQERRACVKQPHLP